jgi:hypothetical protein
MPAAADGLFDLGRRRAEMERRWPPELQDLAVRLLESVPAAVRDWGKHQIYRRIREIAAERPPTVADVESAWAETRSRLTRALGEHVSSRA